MTKQISIGGVTLVALLLGGCDFGNGSTTGGAATGPTAPTAPTAAATLETFSGTVNVGGADAHTFSVVQAGSPVNVTLTQAGPPPDIAEGIGVGTPSGTACALLSGAQALARPGPAAQISGTASAGTYCVAVFDAGQQTAQISYTITVSHF